MNCTPAIFNKDLLVPVTVGPRLEVAVGFMRYGLSGAYALNPKSSYLSFDAAFSADVGVQFGHVGARLIGGGIFGIGTYKTTSSLDVQVTRSVVMIPIRLGVYWEL